MNDQASTRTKSRSYSASLLGNIRQILTGLNGFQAMARELIQNADDAGAEHMVFDISDRALTIWNDAVFSNCGTSEHICPWLEDGNPHSGTQRACDFHAISTVGSGNKYSEKGLIGRFGIGFVSVYQITDEPRVRSKTTQLAFHPLSEEVIETPVDESPGSTFELRWAFDGKSTVRRQLKASPMRQQDIPKLQEHLVRVANDCLLFLKRLRVIEVKRNGVLVSKVEKSITSHGYVRLEYPRKSIVEDWYVLDFDAASSAEPLRKKYEVIDRLDRQTSGNIAFRLGEKVERVGQLFAYLATDQASPIPCHINADFFPDQTRKALVFEGEQHERYWNEMLLQVAAETVGSKLSELRDVLGGRRLWEMLSEAHNTADHKHFGVFWKELSKAAATQEIVPVFDGTWALPADCSLSSKDLDSKARISLLEIGVRSVEPNFMHLRNTLREIGVRDLTISGFAEAYEEWWGTSGEELEAKLRATVTIGLWSIIEALIPETVERVLSSRRGVGRLVGLTVFQDVDGDIARLVDLKRLPDHVDRNLVRAYFPELRFASDKLSDYPRTYRLVNELAFSGLLKTFSEVVEDEDAARTFFKDDRDRIRSFYDLLARYPKNEDDKFSSALEGIPFLRGHDKFLTPGNAVMPGGFSDPVGRFDILNLDFFSSSAQDFLARNLNVKTLTFEEYITEHLDEILDKGLSETEYTALFEEFIDHLDILKNKELRQHLSDLSFVRTIDDHLRPPSDCYFRTDDLAELMGDDPSLWVEQTGFGSLSPKVVKAFLSDLGMRSRPSLSHVVSKLEEIVAEAPCVQTRDQVSRLFVYLVGLFESEKLAEKEEQFEEEVYWLRSEEWLPAERRGELVTEYWYAPHEAYQPFRSKGFDSQVDILAISGAPRTQAMREFLDFLEMPSEPSTQVVVDHLKDCISNALEPNDVVFQILLARLKSEVELDKDVIAQLRDEDVVYNSKSKKFISTKRVFWNQPVMPRYCFTASGPVVRHRDLFEFLGVEEDPVPETYADVLIEVSDLFSNDPNGPSGDDDLIMAKCSMALSEAYRHAPGDVVPQLERLRDHPFLRSNGGALAFIDEVAVKDSDWLAEPFGGELDDRLLKPAPEFNTLLEYFKVKKLSEVAHIKIVDLGNRHSDERLKTKLSERVHLVMWLLHTLPPEIQTTASSTLRKLRIVKTDRLQVKSVFTLTDVDRETEVRDEQVHFDSASATLFVHEDLDEDIWTPAFKVLFSTLLAGSENADPRQLAMNADSILSAQSEAKAKKKLADAGFAKPTEEVSRELVMDEDDDLGDIIDDEDEWSVGEEPSKSAGDQNEASDDAGDQSPGGSGDAAWSDTIEDDVVIETEHSSPNQKSEGNASDAHIHSDAYRKNAKKSENSGDGVAPSVDRSGPIQQAKATDTGNKGQSGERAAGGAQGGSETTVRSPSIRTQYMRSYVMPADRKPTDNQNNGGSSSNSDANMEIDACAMDAVMDYEARRGAEPDRQPHNNPGYDVVSRLPNTDVRRLIEVKGLAHAWTDRGVKLSRTQMQHARKYGDEYWLYVVENALDPKSRKVHAIQNPFEKADEFWFDQVWRAIADETGGDQKSKLEVGLKVNVEGFGIGTIEMVKPIGSILQLTIDFKLLGKRSLAYNSSRFELVEE